MKFVRWLPGVFILLHALVAALVLWAFFQPSADANHPLVLVLLLGVDPIMIPLLRIKAFADGSIGVWISAVAVLGTLQWGLIGLAFRALLLWTEAIYRRGNAGPDAGGPRPG